MLARAGSPTSAATAAISRTSLMTGNIARAAAARTADHFGRARSVRRPNSAAGRNVIAQRGPSSRQHTRRNVMPTFDLFLPPRTYSIWRPARTTANHPFAGWPDAAFAPGSSGRASAMRSPGSMIKRCATSASRASTPRASARSRFGSEPPPAFCLAEAEVRLLSASGWGSSFTLTAPRPPPFSERETRRRHCPAAGSARRRRHIR